MRSTGWHAQAWGPYARFAPPDTGADDPLARWRARGGNERDLMRLAQEVYPELGPREALLSYMRDAGRAEKAPQSDRFDTPYDPTWKGD